MEFTNKVFVVTGGGSGIGAALCRRFAREGANVVVADLNHESAASIANDINGLAIECDVTREQDIQHLVQQTEHLFGPISLFCSNAGICPGEPDHAASADNTAWQACWDIHVMAHVYAARAVLPSMLERGEGHLLQMASAAGLLCQIGDAAYSATKHAAVSFAESLAIAHGDDGIAVSVVCPQYVATPMLGYTDSRQAAELPGVISAEFLAETVIEGVRSGEFLILPHPEVADYAKLKAGDRGRWIGGMRKLRRNIIAKAGGINLKTMHKLIG